MDQVLGFARNLMNGISHLHDANNAIIHRDIKPDNLLLFKTGSSLTLRVADFSVARFQNSSTDPTAISDGPLTPDMSSRAYSAPEMLLNMQYGVSIDVWAAACVIAECATGSLLFAGDEGDETELGQLRAIFTMLGPPSPSLWPSLFEQENDGVSTESSACRVMNIAQHIRTLAPQCDERVPHLCEKMLKYDPTRRITSHAAASVLNKHMSGVRYES